MIMIFSSDGQEARWFRNVIMERDEFMQIQEFLKRSGLEFYAHLDEDTMFQMVNLQCDEKLYEFLKRWGYV